MDHSKARYELASARRLYLHWAEAGNPDPEGRGRLRQDFARVMEGYERAVDLLDVKDAEIARLRLEIEGLREMAEMEPRG